MELQADCYAGLWAGQRGRDRAPSSSSPRRTSPTASARRPRSATTASRSARPGAGRPGVLDPRLQRSNASAGSSAASRAPARRAATRSRAASSPRGRLLDGRGGVRPRAPCCARRACACARSRETMSQPTKTSRSPATIAPTSDAPRNAGASTSSDAVSGMRRVPAPDHDAQRHQVREREHDADRGAPRAIVFHVRRQRRMRTMATIGRNVNTKP